MGADRHLEGIERLHPSSDTISYSTVDYAPPHVVHEGRHELRPRRERLAALPALTESQRRLFYEIPKRYQRKARWWFRSGTERSGPR